jgi:hypothetical protein
MVVQLQASRRIKVSVVRCQSWVINGHGEVDRDIRFTPEIGLPIAVVECPLRTNI